MTPHDLIAAFEAVVEAPDGVERLRELVLQLAVRGRLIPQDPADEPGSVLLERIAAEKARLIRAERISERRVPEPIAPAEQPFDIPDSWAWARLSQLTHDLGQEVPKRTFSYIDVGSIDNVRGAVADELAIIKPADAPSRARKLVKSGTVIYSTVRPYLRNIAVIEREYAPSPIASTAFAVLHPHTGMDGRLLFLWLRSPFFTRHVANQMKGVAYPAINDASLLRAPVPLPPLAEQHRIVARVDELMGLLDHLDAARTSRDATRAAVRDSVLNALREAETTDEVEVAWNRFAERMDDLLCDPADIAPMRQTIFQLAVRGRLVPQDPTEEPASVLLERIAAEKARLVRAGKIPKQEPLSPAREETVPFEIPKGWEWARIAHVSALVTDGVHKTPRYVSNGVPFLSIKDISAGSIDFSDTRFITKAEHAEINKRCNPEKGDILFCRIGTLGKAVVVDTEKPFSLFVSVGLIKLTRQLNSHFLCMALNSPAIHVQYQRIKAGGSHTEKLNLGPMRALILPLPPLAEQHRIVACVGELMGLLDRLEQRLVAARTAHVAFAAAATHHLDAL